jgi:hypothetical protein
MGLLVGNPTHLRPSPAKFDIASEPHFPFFPLSPFPFSGDPPDVFLVPIPAEKQAER